MWIHLVMNTCTGQCPISYHSQKHRPSLNATAASCLPVCKLISARIVSAWSRGKEKAYSILAIDANIFSWEKWKLLSAQKVIICPVKTEYVWLELFLWQELNKPVFYLMNLVYTKQIGRGFLPHTWKQNVSFSFMIMLPIITPQQSLFHNRLLLCPHPSL